MIPASVIEDIRYRCDIESVISSYVTLKRAGSNLKGLCPFHSEKTPSFTVYPGTQSYYCFGCGAGGDVINFVMRTENLDYVAAVETLAKRAGITLTDFDSNSGRPDGVSRSRVLQMNLEAAKFYRQMLFNDSVGGPGRKYFLDRGLSMAAIKRFGLGYSPPSGGSMLKHLRSLGFKEEEIRVAYFAGKNERGYYDYFRGRVMFPIIDVSGNVVAFGGRVLDDSKPKYLNTSDTPAFKKSKNMFALNYAKNSDAGYFILCEGYMDVITLHDAGFGMAVATLGTAITAEQARMMKKYTDRVVISYDSDEAGQKAANRAITLLEEAGIDAKVLRMQGAKDPDEYIKKYGADKFRELIEASRGKFEFMLDGIRGKYDISISDAKIKAISDVCSYIAGIDSSVERDIYIDKASREFSVDIKSIKADVEAKRKKRNYENSKKRKGELIRITSGIGDRINPDFAKQPKGARIEEAVLGMLFIRSEYFEREVDGKGLCEADFVTSLGKRLYSFASEQYINGGFNLGMLNERFTPDEVSRVHKMIADRNELSGNDEKSFDIYVRSMREESASAASGELSLEDILKRKRGETDN
ncbi:MAG: DNA primase [Ruminococcaceae bacterium]|nr:DNA primase [Oscillospiraceae bacterium]